MGVPGPEQDAYGIAIARRMADAFNARDGRAFAALFHADVEFTPLLTPASEPYQGPAGMQQYVHDTFAWAEARLTLGDVVSVGDVVVSRARLEISRRDRRQDLDVLYVARLLDGLVVELVTLPTDPELTDPLGVPVRQTVEQLRLELPAVASSVALARRAVRAYAAGLGCRDLDDVELATSEAVTNAVLHAYLDGPPGPLLVTGRPDGETFLVGVEDRGRGLLPRPDSPGLGMGISMMSTLAVDVTFIGPPQREAGTEVRMRFNC